MCPVGADVYYHVPGCLFRHVSGRRAYRPAERASGGSRPSVAGNTRDALTPPGLETFETSETENVVNKQQNNPEGHPVNHTRLDVNATNSETKTVLTAWSCRSEIVLSLRMLFAV
ncbi:hypothetical protein RRG08_038134 [Elysia crispata]|uniref:Uncharacterized protein n=1 Tax=Elysia crispata TaxID=231223 RepID=A0AAE0ZYZ8_9GAST|nr:hypothetical protein RRG08_038134 [Elysia crispata]